MTRWDTRENFEKWQAARPTGGHAQDERRSMRVEPMGFDVLALEDD